MQTAETFEQLYKVLEAIDKIEAQIKKLLDQIKGFKSPRQMA